ncbi:MAG: hypothetical protein IJ566_02220 [Cardiobacteriaceae bacterium]|nr:hypothetical protein [Cardiobacteriaceae bacterium]
MQKKPSIVMFKTGKDLADIENPSVEEILSNVCASWKVDKERILNIKYAAAVIENKIIAVFEVSKWVECGDRYRFIGKQASPNIAHLFVGKDVSEYYNGSQNPVKYLDDGVEKD